VAEDKTFESKLESKLKPDESPEKSLSYSDEYKTFRNEQLSKTHTFYEKACKSVAGLKVKVSDKKREDINTYTKLAHINVTPEGVYALTYLVTLIFLALSFAAFFFVGLGLAVLGGILTLTAFLILPKAPSYIYNTWRARASDQLVLAVLYLVIYMKREANLENAIWFVSKQLPPPISLDFMKILWDVETKTFSTVRESLENYTTSWKEKEAAFVDSIHLVEASLSSPTKEQADSLLSKATDVILQGTQDSMTKNALTKGSITRSNIGRTIPNM